MTADITLSSGVIVSVEAGVEIEVQGAYKITCGAAASGFHFGGTQDAPIHVHGMVGTIDSWIGFVTDPASRIRAKHTTFENALVLFDLGLNSGGILWLEDCIVRNNQVGIKMAGTGCKGLILGNIFEHNRFGLYGNLDWNSDPVNEVESTHLIRDNHFRENHWAIYQTDNDAGLDARDNFFYRNERGALRTATGISGGTITLENNWWGSDSGPNETSGNPTGTGEYILNAGSSDLDYDPWTTLGRYVPIPDDVREYVNRILRQGTLSGEESATTLLDDESLDRMIDRAEKRVDRWMSPGPPLEKRFLGYGSETQEMHDVRPGHHRIQLKYRPIIAVTLVEIRGGSGSSWSTISEQESGGWYASEENKQRGRIHIDTNPMFEKDSFRVTYTHGHYDAPEEVRGAVIRLVALEVFSAILQAGEDDPYAARAQVLREELKELKEELLERKKKYVVF